MAVPLSQSFTGVIAAPLKRGMPTDRTHPETEEDEVFEERQGYQHRNEAQEVSGQG